jgi:hypothetical protein
MSLNNKREENRKFNFIRNLPIIYDLKFDPIKAFLNHNQELILEQKNHVVKNIRKWDLIKSDDPIFPSGFERYEDDVMLVGEFNQILNTSILLTVYGMFENELYTLCCAAGKIVNSKLTPKDLSGRNYIGQCRKYLDKIVELDLTRVDPLWNELIKIQRLRNAIAHNNRRLKVPEPDIIDYISRTDGLRIDHLNEIYIENDAFMYSFVNKVIEFLTEAINLIEEQKKPSLNKGYKS